VNAKQARRRRRANKPKKPQYVKHLNKMQVADSLIQSDPPSRIYFKREEDGRVGCYICNRTSIMAIGRTDHSVTALVQAAEILRDEYDEESMYVIDEANGIDHDALTQAAARAAMQPDPIPTIDPTNPAHVVCDTCEAGINEKCVTRNGTELKNFHVARTRTARQYANAMQYGADAAKAQQDREQPSA
jgi:hypothetical protein